MASAIAVWKSSVRWRKRGHGALELGGVVLICAGLAATLEPPRRSAAAANVAAVAPA